MIDHLEIATGNIGSSSAFYRATLRTFGYRLAVRKPEVVGFECDNGKDLWIRAHVPLTQPHFAFRCSNRAEVDGAFDAGIRAGGQVSHPC